MNQFRLEELCKQLRLPHLPLAVDNDSFETKEEWLMNLLENELTCREELKMARLYRQAKFPVRRTLDNYEWHDHIAIPNETTKDELISLSFIRQKRTLCLWVHLEPAKPTLPVRWGRWQRKLVSKLVSGVYQT